MAESKPCKRKQVEVSDFDTQWAKLVRRGDRIVLAEPSMSTPTEMRHDYAQLCWCARQLEQWALQIRTDQGQPTLISAKQAFQGTILVGNKEKVPYVTDAELQKQIDQPKAPSSFAEEIVTRRWGFTKSTGEAYLRRKTSKR